ncbi:MAG: DUF4080 domain-containing protein [Oscillospiraceae bacterium]|nr:DUF4080 domain-containing protein [Oscillospiraceae bacterium]
MKVVFVALNSKYSHASLAPWCLLAGIKKYAESDVEAFVCEGTVNEKEDVLFERVMGFEADLIGFCTYIWNVKTVLKLAERVKKARPGIVIVLGGPEVSYNAEDVLLKNDFVDCVVSGEGEEPIARLCDCLSLKREIPDGYGICRRSGEGIIVNPPFISPEEPPSPYCDEFYEALGSRMPYIETSRGCPYSCAFCLSGRCGGVRFFDIERAKSEIISLAKKTASVVKFVDRTFNANKSRAKEIFRFICENYGREIPSGVCFHFEIAGDILDDETIELLNNAPHGAIQLEIGMQSFNEKTLSYINRKTDTEKLKKNILRLTERKNIHIHIDLIAGLPYEGMDSFADSFNTGFFLGADMLQMGFLKLLHGADMREESEKYPCEFADEPPYEVLSTPWLSREEMEILHKTEDALDRLCNSGRFKRTVEYIIAVSGKTPFEIFRDFGIYAAEKGTAKISLDDYTALVLSYFSKQDGVDGRVLRDKMVCDRFATNSFGLLPETLKIHDPDLLNKARQHLNSNESTRQQRGIKRALAVLYSESEDGRYCGVYADYDDNAKNRHSITAPEYKLNKFYFEFNR